MNFSTLDFGKETELCKIMRKYGSDKALYGISNRHNYTLVYDFLFREMQSKSINLLEVGLGTNNVSFPSNMGEKGCPCASIKGWREYFTNGNIFGADVDPDILISGDRIKCSFCDMTKPETIKKMFEKFGNISYDIIIDDGLHEFHANQILFENSICNLKPGGYYIVEDVMNNQWCLGDWEKYLKEISFKYPDLESVVLTLPNVYNNDDNVLIIFKKKI
jgi:hypothetical protein